MKVRYNVTRLIVWKAAIVLYPYVLFRRGKREVSDRLFRHELEHVYQVKRMGWFKFYSTYLWYSLRHGYWNNPYEIEARAMENEPLTDAERALRRN
jgi:hypothetical protein